MDTNSFNDASPAPLGGAKAATLLIAVKGVVDFNEPLVTDTDLKARLLGQINDSLYPFVVAVTSDDDTAETPYQVDNDGEIKGNVTFSIENEQEEQPEVNHEGIKVIREPVSLPAVLKRQVRTSKGSGVLIKVRNDEKRPFGVLLDTRRHETDPEIFWAFAHKTTFL